MMPVEGPGGALSAVVCRLMVQRREIKKEKYEFLNTREDIHLIHGFDL